MGGETGTGVSIPIISDLETLSKYLSQGLSPGEGIRFEGEFQIRAPSISDVPAVTYRGLMDIMYVQDIDNILQSYSLSSSDQPPVAFSAFFACPNSWVLHVEKDLVTPDREYLGVRTDSYGKAGKVRFFSNMNQ